MYRHTLKRIFDLALTVPALIILSPLLLVLSLLVVFTMGTPILFVQQRPGLHGKPFKIYKFRTMTNARDRSGKLLPDEKRITRLGHFLRSTSLDELPELINVIKGDMSIVGPRPLLLRYLNRYSAYHAQRHTVRPGITGWAQINGRNAISWDDKLDYDIWYVKHCSLWLDIYIILVTLVKVLRREGISSANHATMPEFLGTFADKEG